MWDIIGHQREIEGLRRAVALDTVPQALLVTGPSGIGKTRLATELAKALNCTGTDPPCQRCVHCRQTEARAHPDVSFVERIDGKDSISIQQVRELREGTSLRPFQGSRRVCIVSGAEALTAQAADALLKTLEEPQARVTIILTAIDAESLPSTVVSRCRHLPLRPVDANVITRSLRERGEDGDRAAKIAHLAHGGVGWALAATKQPKLAAQRESRVDQMIGIMDMDLAARLDLAEELTSDRKDRAGLRTNLELLLLVARDLMLVSLGGAPQVASETGRQALTRQGQRLELPQLNAYLQGIRLCMERVDQNVDPRLALEALLTNLP